jgi:hypothetical protein
LDELLDSDILNASEGKKENESFQRMFEGLANERSML